MKNVFTPIIVFFLFLGFINTGFAFNYSEPPDLRSWDGDYLGILALGANTVSGDLDSSSSGSFDLDSFTFTLAEGMVIESIQFDFIIGSGSSSMIRTSFRIEDSDGSSVVDFGEFDLLSTASPIIIPDDLSGMTPGLYEMHNYRASKIFNRSVELDYTWTITTAAVPIPGALLLLLSGLVGLAGFRRK